MFAEACRFYGWTLEYCLNMPASHFFLMLEESRRLYALEQIESCDIAVIPACNSKYLEVVRRRYERVLELDNIKKEVVEDVGNVPIRPVVDSASQDAKYMMMAFFNAGKDRIH